MHPINQPHHFSLTLFSTNCDFISQAVPAGIDEIMVDWEHIGKAERQTNADTDINYATLNDLQNVRHCTSAKVICRLNAIGPTTFTEIEQAIDAGADEIMIPMIRTPAEVERILKKVEQRCGVGILVETVEAMRHLHELGKLPLSRVYVGLNDLAIERGTPNIFTALNDGTVEYIRSFFDTVFGFGGLTLPEMGYPLPCRLLIAEMARLKCQYTFLRRSFLRDIQGRELSIEVPRLQKALADAWQRSDDAVAQDKFELEQAIIQYSLATRL